MNVIGDQRSVKYCFSCDQQSGMQSSPWYLHTFILLVDPLVSWNGPTLIAILIR